MVEAAAIPLALITAWEALVIRGDLKEGQSMLIHAGAGGVGHIAIQLAHYFDALVATTISGPKKAEFVQSLGVELAIDYRQQDFVEAAMNWTDGMYSGPVVAQDDQAWLIKIGTGRAGVLSFTEIEEDAVIPRLGDNILLTLTHGIVHVVVVQSANNAGTEARRLE